MHFVFVFDSRPIVILFFFCLMSQKNLQVEKRKNKIIFFRLLFSISWCAWMSFVLLIICWLRKLAILLRAQLYITQQRRHFREIFVYIVIRICIVSFSTIFLFFFFILSSHFVIFRYNQKMNRQGKWKSNKFYLNK